MSKQDSTRSMQEIRAANKAIGVQVMRIADDGSLEPDPGPLTWDGEPVYCEDTVREARAANVPLFDPAAFEQLAGQLALEDGE